MEDAPKIVQLTLGEFRALCEKENWYREFKTNTAALPSSVIVQVSEIKGPSILVDSDGYMMELA